MFLRRTFPFLASWFGQPAAAATPRRDFFAGLNLRSPITAAEPFTTLSGSLMQPEVAEAWQYAVSRHARLDELHDATGKRIAAPIGCEAAMGHSHSRHRRLPHRIGPRENPRLPGATGMKNEVIIQKSHRYVESESAEELERAVCPMTAMLHFFNTNEPAGHI